MKANKEKAKKIAVVLLSGFGMVYIVCWLMAGIFMLDYPRNPHNKKADDAISRAVYEAVGAKELYYQGKSENRAGTTTYYEFYINKEKEGLIEEVVDAINEVLKQEKSTHKVCIRFTESFLSGGYESLFGLYNYTDENSSFAIYGQLQCLHINGTDMRVQESIYNDPETYKNLQDIRHLGVSEKIQNIANEQGIDWYEYWPELETVELY